MATKTKKTARKPVATIQTDTVLVLRTCGVDMTGYGEFKWPTSGPVECPDWKPIAECGHGLHGFLWGEGDGSLANWSESAKWLVVEVLAADIVQLDGKVKFPRGIVLYAGDRLTATAMVAERRPGAIVGGTATAGYSGTATAGDRGTATAGYSGTATAGDRGTATAGYRGTATAGDSGTATAGYSGTATAGYSGTATAGDRGTATAGYSGTATAGYSGTATAGDSGTICIRHWDEKCRRYRTTVGYIGEDGLRPLVKYRLDDAGRLVEVKDGGK